LSRAQPATISSPAVAIVGDNLSQTDDRFFESMRRNPFRDTPKDSILLTGGKRSESALI
jgi:hypothetical protein